MTHVLRPPRFFPLFSHQFPCTVHLPGSELYLTVYPACIEFCGKVLFLQKDSHFQSHTTFFDCRHRTVTIEGETKAGFQRLFLFHENGFWVLRVEKRPLYYSLDGVSSSLQKGEQLPLFSIDQWKFSTHGQLVLTSPRKNQWEQLLEKKEWISLIEHLYLYAPAAATDVPCELPKTDSEECASLFKVVSRDSIDKVDVEKRLIFFLVHGFSGLFVPRVGEDVFKRFGRALWPFSSLQENFFWLHTFLRSLFLREENGEIFLLPCLLRSLHSGQLINEPCMNGAMTLSFDWRQGKVRRLSLQAERDIEAKLHIPHHSTSRLRRADQKGVRMIKTEETLFFEKGKRYLLDTSKDP